MNYIQCWLIGAIVVAALIAILVSITWLGNDNPVEKVAEVIIEDVVKSETGIDVKLTPPDTTLTPPQVAVKQ